MQPYIIIPPSGSDQSEEWVRLGVAAQSANKFAEAEGYYRQALRLDPRHVVATQNLAVLFAQQGNLNEALLAIDRAEIFDGGKHAVIYVNRAYMHLDADRLDEAMAAAHRAIEVADREDPTTPAGKEGATASRLVLAVIAATAGEPEKSVPLYNYILDRQPGHPVAGPNSCFVSTLVDASPADLLAQRRRWYEANRFTGVKRPHDNNRNPDRPLRVGYVGGDFKRHSAAMIFGAVVLHHDPKQVEQYLYSSLPVNPAGDDLTKRFQDAVGERWRDISAMNDEDAENLIRRDRIDILVDLAGHTNGGRLGIFTRKAAPIQVSAWGFAHGTGVPEVDYFLADRVVVPEGEEQFYAERVVYLPCVVTYLEPKEYNLKGKSPLPFYKNDYITFGSYARYEKLSDECLRVFAEILRRVPESRLEFKDHAFRRPYSIRRVLRAMPDIDPARILFSISTAHPDHLLAYQQADLLLDPFPHGGGVVCLEQLYMGVPIVTYYGRQASGRTTSSVLTAMGHADWIARSAEEYVNLAVEFAEDTASLNRLRRSLREEFLASPVVQNYRETVETVYREMWRVWATK